MCIHRSLYVWPCPTVVAKCIFGSHSAWRKRTTTGNAIVLVMLYQHMPLNAIHIEAYLVPARVRRSFFMKMYACMCV